MKHFIAGLMLCFAGYTWSSPIEIVLWHSMAGHLGEEVQQLINGFNKSQREYVIKPVYKGEYMDSLTSFAAAFRAKQPPAIVQVFEVGTAIMLAPKGIIKPLNELIDEQNVNLPITSFLPAIRDFYSKDEKLQAMPFNTSIPVIYYNRDALAKVGITPKTFPKTWAELEKVAADLKKAGNTCAYTTAYPAWIQIESFSALHGLPMVTSDHKQALYNNLAIIHHFERLKAWQTKRYFEYGGRNSDATVLFTSGRCAMFSQSSGSYSSLAALVKFNLGVAALPMDYSVSKIRHNNVIGGAALWTVAGYTQEKYRGIALFYDYIARPDVQQYWHQQTGYIPLGLEGQYAMLTKEKNQPTLALAMQDLASIDAHPFKPYGVVQNQIRTINDEAIEAIFAGIKTPAEAINDAALRANFALMRFARNTGIN